MLTYVVRRLLWGLVVLVSIGVITFVLVYILPADPARVIAGPRASADAVARISHQLGLDQPLPVQAAAYIGRALQGDLGHSFSQNEDVLPLILSRFPATLQLAIAGLIVELIIGVPLGLLASHPSRHVRRSRRDGALDHPRLGPVVLGRPPADPLPRLPAVDDLGDRPLPDRRIQTARPALPHPAGDHRRVCGCRVPHPPDPGGDDRGAEQGLRPHGSGEGPAGEAGHPQTCLPQRRRTDPHPDRAGLRLLPRRHRRRRIRSSAGPGSASSRSTRSGPRTCP